MKWILLLVVDAVGLALVGWALLGSDANHPTESLRSSVSTIAETRTQSAISPVGKPGIEFDDDRRRPEFRCRLKRETIGRLAFRDILGREYRLDKIRQTGPSVFVFLSTECPLAKRYTGRLVEFHQRFAKRGVSIFGVYSNSNETFEGLKAFARKAKIPFSVIRDADAYIARRLGAKMTPQAILLDREGRVRYCGSIDDNEFEVRARQHYLRDAVAAVLSDKPIKTPVSKSWGCTIHREIVGDIEKVTYAVHVARILQDNCVGCHRPGQVAPFSLTTYKQARRWAKEIKAYTRTRVMPPWKAAAGFGRFQNDCSLHQDEIALLARWVDDGTPLGDKRDLPPAPRFAKSWELGKPDLVLEMPAEYTIGPKGDDDYRHFIIPTKFGRDLYVEAIDVQPGNRKIVHHVLAYTDTSGKARKLDAADPGPGYSRFGDPGFQPASTIGGWAPGSRPIRMPKGTGRWLPKGADVVLQVHYFRSGLTERDRTRIGLYLSKSKKPVRVHVAAAFPRRPKPNRFVIPPGERRHRLNGSYPVKEDIWIFSLTPHMHLLGKEMRVVVENETRWNAAKPLVWIQDWDFNWQLSYVLKQPLFVPKGSTVQLQAWYDNSSKNPRNPNSPPNPVGYGSKTTDEMCYAFFSFVKASEYSPPGQRRQRAGQ